MRIDYNSHRRARQIAVGMITLKMEVSLGTIEISGQSAVEVQTNLAQLLGASDLLASWGRVYREMSESRGEVAAVSNAGSILGAEVIGEAEQHWSFDNPPSITLTNGTVVHPQRYIGNGPNGPQSKALWYGQSGDVSENPMDADVAAGVKRYWQWFE